MGIVYKVINKQIEDFVRKYNGAKFHALLCDPPYELGFMGKDWDKSGVAFHPETWAAIAEHMLPGAFGMAFASARGWHRLACAIEDAGLRIHPSIFGWAYGCVDEATEILTINGFKKYDEVNVGDEIACWNAETNRIDFMPASHKYLAPYSGEMVWIHNNTVDQLLTPNHRVYCKDFKRKQKDGVRYGAWDKDWSVKRAQDLLRSRVIKLPVAAKMTSGPGIGGTDYASLLGWVWTEGHFSHSGGDNTDIHIYQSSVNPQNITIIDRVVKKYSQMLYTRVRSYKEHEYTEYNWRISGDIAHRVRKDLPQKHLTIELIRQMTEEERMAFYKAAMAGDGSGNTFYQKDRRDRDMFQVLSLSLGKYSYQNPAHISVGVRDITSAQVRLGGITSRKYEGYVWSLTVPTGAYVARRGTKVFITGNSGFPKATRIDTQIDKALGKLSERRVIGQQTKARKTDSGVPLPTNGRTVYKTWDITAPASNQARIWAGYRYGLQALKPALEPIIVFQKPYKGKPVNSIVDTGAGALNIDGARIPHNEKSRLMAAQTDKDIMSGHGKIRQGGRHRPTLELKPEGRWPANFYIGDEEAARRLGKQSGKSRSRANKESDGRQAAFYQAGDSVAGGTAGEHNSHNSYSNVGTAARFFFNVNHQLDESDPVLYCAKASKKEKDAGLDKMHNPHSTVKPLDLTRWLATLLLPPREYAPRRILVPFAGSGSEMIGAVLAGWDEIVGIEMNPEYCKIAELRLAYWASQHALSLFAS